MSCVFALIRLPFVIHAIIFGLFLATFCDHFLASFGEQFGYKNFPAHGNPALNVDGISCVTNRPISVHQISMTLPILIILTLIG